MGTVESSKPLFYTSWGLQVIIAAGFLVMGAIPKLTGDPMARELFEMMGAEPAGRYVVGIWELVAAILIVIPHTSIYGAILAALGMLGAIGAHLFGGIGLMPEVTVNAETGEKAAQPMVIFAVIFLIASGAVVFLRRHQLPMGGSPAEKQAVENSEEAS